MPSFVAVAYFLPGRAKDLSAPSRKVAPLHTLKAYDGISIDL